MHKFLLALAAAIAAASASAQASGTEWTNWYGGPYRAEEPATIPRAGDEPPTSARRYFERNASDGTLGRDEAATYWSTRLDGAALDFEAMDYDGDGVASRSEWLTYHRGQAASVALPR